ncbi:MAG: hypothetical protein ABFC67_00630 [Mizugakiibacter sp.]|uniref:hypothetical protein n=1 Tax=Mizugakiibacter sp. TaxID=1972610 RepID=UPI0031C6DA26|nr:hypothetical protein [Xanthomonadaceae bacterium]
MSDFEYISVLLSIILGLGITQLLSGIARLVRDGRALAPAWWLMVMVATLLLVHFQVWWASFVWRYVQAWTFLGYAAFMVLPMLLYLLAYLILPADLMLDGKELVREFIERRRPFYAIVALVPLASFFQQWMLGRLQFDFDAAMRLLWVLLAIPGFVSRRVAVQATLAMTYFVVFVTYICVLFARMQ